MALGNSQRPYTAVWVGWFALLAVAGWAGFGYFGGWSEPPQPDLQLVFAAVGLTMSTVAVLLAQHDAQFLPVLIWGTFLSLLLFVSSDHWVWELAEAYPVKPIAAILQQAPAQQKIYTSYPYNRPSLNFYSDRPVLPADAKQLKRLWRREAQPYLLLDQAAIDSLKLKSAQPIGTAAGWTLIGKQQGKQ